jgi:hypothetical protein
MITSKPKWPRSHVTHVVENNQGLSPAALVIADGMENTAADNGRHKLLNEENQKDAADSGKVEVVDQEQGLELEGLTVAHELAASKDDGIVDDNEDRSGLQSRHRSLEWDEFEFAGRVADNGSPGLVKDRPQMDAKGAVEGWQRNLLQDL